MAEHATSKFCVLLNRMSALCVEDFQDILHPDTQSENMDRGMDNSIHKKNKGVMKKYFQKYLVNITLSENYY